MSDFIRCKIEECVLCAVSLDDPTVNDRTSYMCVHVHIVNSQYQREALFVKPHKLAVVSADAPTLTENLVEVLRTYAGLSKEVIAAKLINISCDGTSVLSGLQWGFG